MHDEDFGVFDDGDMQGFGNNFSSTPNGYDNDNSNFMQPLQNQQVPGTQSESSNNWGTNLTNDDFNFSDNTSLMGTQSDDDDDNGQQVKTYALRIIIVGVVILVLVLLGIRVVNGLKNKDTNSNDMSNNRLPIQTQDNNNNQSNQPINPAQGSDWLSFTSADSLKINQTPSELQFTVLKVENSVKVDSNTNELQIKQTLTGSLAGFKGSYSFDVPITSYSSEITIGNTYNVQVYLGEYDGQTVVCGITF